MTIQSCASGGYLWQKALDAVDTETKSSLAGIINDYKGDIITEILEEAKEETLSEEALEGRVSRQNHHPSRLSGQDHRVG